MYTIGGRRFNSAQIRHLVFYSVPSLDERAEDDVTPSKRQVTSPSPSPITYPENFTVPTPSLSGGEITECSETWDIISEVYSTADDAWYWQKRILCIG